MKRRFGIDSTLIKKSGGIFEVTWGDELLFSKKALGRFPTSGEVEQTLAARLGDATS